MSRQNPSGSTHLRLPGTPLSIVPTLESQALERRRRNWIFADMAGYRQKEDLPNPRRFVQPRPLDLLC